MIDVGGLALIVDVKVTGPFSPAAFAPRAVLGSSPAPVGARRETPAPRCQRGERRVLYVGVWATACEPLRRAKRCEALHVGDLAVAEPDHLEAFESAITAGRCGGADDRVIAYLPKLWLYLEPPFALFFQLESQDLTGLVGPSSRGRVFPPEMAVRDAAPFRVLGE